MTTLKERYQHWLKTATEDSDILVFIESECARREALGVNKGLVTAMGVAELAKATFFTGPDYKQDKKVDRIVDESLYELRAEIVDGISALLHHGLQDK